MTVPTEPVQVNRSIVDVADFKKYMSNVNLDADQWASADLVLAGVQQELETYLNRPIQPIRIREVCHVDDAGYINLTATPVWEITEMVVVGGGTPLPATVATLTMDDATVVANYIHNNYASGPMRVPGGVRVGYMPDTDILVDYIGGWDGYQVAGLKLAIMRVAAREMTAQNDDFLSLQSSTAQEGSKPDDRDLGWTVDELVRWDRLRRRVIA